MAKPKACSDRVKFSTKRRKKRRFPVHTVNNNDSPTVNNLNNESLLIYSPTNDDVHINSNLVAATDVDDKVVTDAVNTENSTNILDISAAKVCPIQTPKPSQGHNISGYRLIDMTVLDTVFQSFLCPSCKLPSIRLCEDVSKKQGLASYLYVQCSNCEFVEEFYSSPKTLAKKATESSFDVNLRMTYTMRSIGQGHSGMEKFTSLMDMPKPMTRNNYDKLVKKLSNVTKLVAEETMNDAAKEICSDAPDSEVVNTSVSCDGSWQRRGFASLNGVVTAISIDNGKILDVEAMNRICKSCSLKSKLKETDPDAYAIWKLSHTCTLNYTGSAPGMESVGTKKIFELIKSISCCF